MMTARYLALTLSLVRFSGSDARPPALTLDKHVDYVAWWKTQFAPPVGERNALELYTPPAVADNGDGAMPLLKDAALKEYDRWTPRPWRAEEFPELNAYIERVGPYLDALERAAAVKHFWDPVPEDVSTLADIKMPHLGPMYSGSRVILARAWRASPPDPKAIIDAARVCLRLADHAEQSPWFVSAYVGLAIRNKTYDSILAALEQHIITGDNILRAYEVLREYDPGPLNWNRLLMAKWAVCLDTIQSVCVDGRVQMDRWKQSGDTHSFDPREAIKFVDERYKAFIEITDEPIKWKTVAALFRLNDSTEKSRVANDFTRVVIDYLETRTLTEALRTETRRYGTMIALALYAHHEKHGEWPKRLRDTDKDVGLKDYRRYGKEPFTGKLFKYRLVDGKPLLYSVAWNLKDDGGLGSLQADKGTGAEDIVIIPFRR